MNSVNLKCRIKYGITLAIMCFLRILWFFPLKNDYVLFQSFGGKQYSDSPKYFSEYLRENDSGKKIIWVLQNTDAMESSCADFIVKRKSLKYFYYFCTSGTIVTNDSLSSYLPVRKRQIVINTWHGGGPLKTVGFKEKIQNPYNEYFYRLQNKKIAAFISSSSFFSEEVIEESFHNYYSEKLNFGMPRSDILFSFNEDIIRKVYRFIGKVPSDNVGLVLYAPTFRGTTSSSTFLRSEEMLNVESCLSALEKRFCKKFYFLFRAHHTMDPHCFGNQCISMTSYPDMQELICAVDVLITDYSSCMHDCALIKKPVFLYIPDCVEYLKNRGMYWDFNALPYPFAEDNEGLCEIIKKFDSEEYQEDIIRYLKEMNNFENGTANARLYEWLSMKKSFDSVC